MIAPDIKPCVELIGEDGNSMSIIGKVCKALKKNGADSQYIDQYMEKAMSGDYDNLLRVTREYVDIK